MQADLRFGFLRLSTIKKYYQPLSCNQGQGGNSERRLVTVQAETVTSHRRKSESHRICLTPLRGKHGQTLREDLRLEVSCWGLTKETTSVWGLSFYPDNAVISLLLQAHNSYSILLALICVFIAVFYLWCQEHLNFLINLNFFN